MNKIKIKQIIKQQLNKLLTENKILNEVKTREQIRKQRNYIYRDINPNNQDFSYLLFDNDLSYQEYKKLLQKPQINVNVQDKFQNNSVLHTVVQLQIDLQKFKLLLNHPNIDVNVTNHKEITPLLYCLSLKREQMFTLLVNHPKIDINKQDKYKYSIIHFVSFERYGYNYLQVLLQHPKIDVNIKNIYGDTPLHILCNHNKGIQLVKLLLNHPNIDVNVKNEKRLKAIQLTDNKEIKNLIKNHPTYKGK